MTIDILISVKDARIVRIKEAMPEPKEGVHYFICFQYTDDKFLDLIPQELAEYPDVTLIKSKEVGLSNSRNALLQHATGNLLYFIDDDTVLLPYAIDNIIGIFQSNPDIDIALFQSQSYGGKLLRKFPPKVKNITSFRDRLNVLAYEVVCRREKVQNVLSYNSKFGLGSSVFVCYEQQVFLEDALRHGLKLRYFPLPVIKTSAIYKPRMVLVDRHVQRALGGLLSYVYNKRAFYKACQYCYFFTHKAKVSMFPFMHYVFDGIFIERRNRNK